MLALLALTLKKTITLVALVGPVGVIPIFLAAVEEEGLRGKLRFARTVGLSVTIALLIAAFLGLPLLGLLGVSLGAMQVGGGIIVLLLAIAMVLGQETTFKGVPAGAKAGEVRELSIIPLAVPLLAGPAAFSYVMANSVWHDPMDLVHVVAPILIVGIVCWFVFRSAALAGKAARKSTLNLVERIGGFILAAMAIEMIAAGLRGLFPMLTS
ncbi:MAG: MarC family protein [Rhodocyclaceae bacterium]|nr:MarC family protein [Rhodocyclaceae bacterium]